VKLDANFPTDLARAGAVAAELERLGYDGLWTAETPHDPFLPLAASVATTQTMRLGTGIATAFTRSPMLLAMAAWDIQRASGGRFVLGLGTQVKAHNARRYSTPAEHPNPMIRELIAALRHVWGAFQGEHPLSHRGEHYRLDLMTPLHSPGPIEHPHVPIHLAAVGPAMFRIAGELADGVHVHPFHTVEYLRQVGLPALEEGLDRSGRSRGDVEVLCGVFALAGANAAAEKAVRAQIGFYGSTRIYQPVFEVHGWGALTDTLRGLAARGDVDGLAAAIPDEVLETFAVVGSDWHDVMASLRRRYEGVLDRVGVYALRDAVSLEDAPEIARAFASTVQA
jgi:probable F420-dependent oxidoreductase